MKIEEIIVELNKVYPDNFDIVKKIDTLFGELEPLTERDKIEPVLEGIQECCNRLYDIKYDDILIDLQVVINEYRHKYDITDPREIIHYDNGKGFVQ